MPRRNSSFACVELDEPLPLAARPGRTARCSGSRRRPRSRTAPAGPGRRRPSVRVAGRCPTSTPTRSSGSASTARTGRASPGMSSSTGTIVGSPSTIRASIIPNAARALRVACVDQALEAVARRRLADRQQDPPELVVPALEVGREPVVALDEPGQLVLAGHLDARRQVARRRPLDGLRHGPQRRGQVVRQDEGEEDGDDDRRGEHEDDDADQGRVDLAGPR